MTVLWYGSRKSPKFIRSYRKESLKRFRVELELHAAFLRKHHVCVVQDIPELAFSLLPKHFAFVQWKWRTLGSALEKKYGKQRGRQILSKVRQRSASLHRASRELAKFMPNGYRFRQQMRINKEMQQALDSWHRELSKGLPHE